MSSTLSPVSALFDPCIVVYCHLWRHPHRLVKTVAAQPGPQHTTVSSSSRVSKGHSPRRVNVTMFYCVLVNQNRRSISCNTFICESIINYCCVLIPDRGGLAWNAAESPLRPAISWWTPPTTSECWISRTRVTEQECQSRRFGGGGGGGAGPAHDIGVVVVCR